MKRLAVSLLLFSLVFGICLLGGAFVGDGYEKICSELDRSEQMMKNGNFEEAKACAERAEELFIKREPFFAAFVSHGTVEEVGTALASVVPLASGESREECLSQIALARTSLTHLHNDHRFILQNLF